MSMTAFLTGTPLVNTASLTDICVDLRHIENLYLSGRTKKWSMVNAAQNVFLQSSR